MLGTMLARFLVGVAWWLGASVLHLCGCWLGLYVLGMPRGADELLTASLGGSVAAVGLIGWGSYMVTREEKK